MNSLGFTFIFVALVTATHHHHSHDLTDDQTGLRVNCKENRFDLDGKPFHYIGGEIHYFRIPRELWNDRLYRMRALGLNVAQIYVAWNFHEEQEGVYNFKGDRDLAEFLRLAWKNGLYVNLRMGPYICAEWEMGGLPWWLLKYENIILRDDKGPFLAPAKRFLKRLAEEVKDLQYPNGPIIAAQVENEYGSYGANHKYVDSIALALKDYGITKALLYTTDGPWGIDGGKSTYAYPTVDFGPTPCDLIGGNFLIQRQFAKCGPHVNSEFYTGWFDGWNLTKHGYPSIEKIIDSANCMVYNHSASFSFYMIHGGTNFGFWHGGEEDATIITTYDYGSPISESGQITDKYLALRRWIKKIPNWKNTPLEIPNNHTAFTIPGVTARRLNRSLPRLFLDMKENCKDVKLPENFEKFDQAFGYAIYSHTFTNGVPKTLSIKHFRDLAYVFIGDEYQGVLGRCNMLMCKDTHLTLNTRAKGPLYIILEELGRLNFGRGNDFKGILTPVKGDGKILSNWTECGVNVNKLPTLISNLLEYEPDPFASENDLPNPGIFLSSFNIKLPDDIGAFTYFDGSNLGKGQFFLNGYNVGRYWPSAGPEISIYVPGVFFKNNTLNQIALINFESAAPSKTLNFVTDLTWKN